MSDATQLTTFHGIRNVYFGIVGQDGKVLTDTNGGFKNGYVSVDGDMQGATGANVTALEEAGTKKYANNAPKAVRHGIPSPQVALTMLDMPIDVYNKLLGKVKSGAATLLNHTNKPNVAMIIQSEDFKGHSIYEAFANGEVIDPAHNHATDTNQQAEADPTLTYTALQPIDDDQFKLPNGAQAPMATYNSGDSNFSEEAMFKEVFIGCTPAGKSAITPSYTSTSTTNG